MAWNDAGETVVAGTGEVYVADTGASLPANQSSNLSAAIYHGLGYHTEDGVGLNYSPEFTRMGAWQAQRPIRIVRGASGTTFTFALLQWNEDTLDLAFGGGDVIDLGGGSYKYVPPSDTDPIAEKTVIIDVIDGSDIGRFVIPRGVATEGVDSTFNDTAMANLPVTVEALEPETGGDAWYFLSNFAGFAAGS